MTVDRAKAVRRSRAGQTAYFCSEHCAAAYDAGAGQPAPATAVSSRSTSSASV
jgi:hypothetical protein